MLPTDILSNREFCFLVPEENRPEGFGEQWIEERSGIQERRIWDRKKIGCGLVNPEAELTLSLGALTKMQMNVTDWASIDAIFTVRSSPANYAPNLSQRIHRALCTQFQTPAQPIFTLDLIQPSTGFLQAMQIARALPFQNTLVVMNEVLSPFLNLKDVGTSILFGDGAAAVWLTRDPHGNSKFCVEHELFYSVPDSSEILNYDETAASFHMKGPELFRKIVPEFKKSSLRVLEQMKIGIEQIQFYLPHQANERMMERIAHALHFSPEQLITNIAKVGNTSSASMMIALDHWLQKPGNAKPGARILLNACGAGLSSGAACIRVL